MELDADTPDAGDLRARVAVVGAGPCGLAVADALREAGVDVVVVEGGGPEDVEVEGPYGPLGDTRAGGVGGTARVWNTVLQGRTCAKYVPLGAHDFEARSWLPHSGWPIGAGELEPWWRRAEELCGLARVRRDVPPSGDGYPLLPPGGGLETGVYQYGPADRFTEELPARLRRSPHATLLCGAGVVGMIPADGGGGVGGVRWRTPSGRSGRVLADRVVLAAGAVENARLLLQARRDALTGIGDGWLGRGFMEHPVDSTLELVTRAEALATPGGFYSQHGVGRTSTVVGRIGLSAELLRSERLPGASIRLREDPPALLEPGPLGGAARTLVPFPAARRALRRGVTGAAGLVARVRGVTYRLLVDLEQGPSRDNAVTLDGTLDPSGVPRARLSWRWSAQDEAGRARTLAAIARAFERTGTGRVRPAARGALDPRAHHHMGTTRMHEDPRHGVVDADLRVHGVDGLYVVGPSVFPTGGFANPTFTAVALALRLAGHLVAA